MGNICWNRYPHVAQSPHGQAWLTIQLNLGLAQNTINAYGRALEDFLAFSSRDKFAPESATREHIARYVHDLSSRPNPRGAKIRALDTGCGLANATLQQRLTAVRLFYDYLTEEGLRETNPVGRGRYTSGKQFGSMRSKGLIPHYTKLPWIPNETEWMAILQAVKQEPIRNRTMLARGYHSGVRREELCLIEIR